MFLFGSSFCLHREYPPEHPQDLRVPGQYYLNISQIGSNGGLFRKSQEKTTFLRILIETL